MVIVIYLKRLFLYGGLLAGSRLFTLGAYLDVHAHESGADFNCIYASKMGTICSEATVIHSPYCDIDIYYLNEYRSQLCVYKSVFINRKLRMESP